MHLLRAKRGFTIDRCTAHDGHHQLSEQRGAVSTQLLRVLIIRAFGWLSRGGMRGRAGTGVDVEIQLTLNFSHSVLNSSTDPQVSLSL